MSTVTAPPPLAHHRAAWKWSLALGGCLLALGLAGITISTLMELTSVLVFGPLLLVSSLIQLLIAFFAVPGKETRLHFTAAGLEALLGFYLMMNPLHRLVGVVIVVGLFLVVGGLVRLARSMVSKSRGRGWIALAGVVSLLLGLSVWAGWPDARLWFVGLCIAVDILCHGLSWSALALAERSPP